MDDGPRNLSMAGRIGVTEVRSPLSFVIAGDSGAWPDPTADAIFAQLLRQIADLRPAPVFFANLGDFAGPGTEERHRRYLELVAGLDLPNVCLIGNHDLEDPRGREAYSRIHGPRNFEFAYGGTRFVAIDGASGHVGELGDTTPSDTAGPSREALRFLDETLTSAGEPNRVVLLHAPRIWTATTRRSPSAASAKASRSSSTSSATTASSSCAAPMDSATTITSTTGSAS
jgi:hypothetical protein